MFPILTLEQIRELEETSITFGTEQGRKNWSKRIEELKKKAREHHGE